MHIGPLRIAHPITLAPLEEHSNYPFRRLMRRCGAKSGMHGTGGCRRDGAAPAAGHPAALYDPAESPRMGQLSGADPVVLAEAARVAAELGFDLSICNFDCPVRRLLARGEGGALMADPPAIARLVAAVVRAVSIPVTLKIRSGPDADRETAVETAQRAEDAGASAVSVHARSVAQGYAGGPDWGVIARVRQAVRIPVIGSGGVRQAADAIRLLAATGAHAVAIGRGCLGNPWIFAQAVALGRAVRPAAGPPPPSGAGPCWSWSKVSFVSTGRRWPSAACRGPPVTLPPRCPAPEFRQALRQVRNLDHFRRLLREFFR